MKKHTFDYLILFTASVLFLLCLKFVQGNRSFGFLTLFSFAAFYILWGITHHIRDENLHLKNVLEYILIGFCVVILLTIIFSF